MENKEEQQKENVSEEVKEEIHKTESATALTTEKKPGLYTAGLICGIVGLCLFWSVWVGLICGILGIVFGAITLNKTNSKVPIILGSVATGLAIIIMIVYSVIGTRIFNSFKEDAKDIFDEIETKYEEEYDDAIDKANEYKEEQEQKDADFEQKTNEMEQQVDSKQEDMDASMNELEKQVNDAFNNALH